MEAELPEFMLYPDFTSTTEVSLAYTVDKLKTILTDCCIMTTCSPTKVCSHTVVQGVVCSHTVVQVPLLAPNHIGDMTDVQVITALQQLGQSWCIPHELEVRLAALCNALAAAPNTMPAPPGTTPVPSVTSPEQMHQQLLDLVSTLQEQIQCQAQDTAALRTAMAKCETSWAHGQGRDHGRARQDEQDDEDIIIQDKAVHTRQRRAVDDLEPSVLPDKVAKGNGVASITAAFVQALNELLGTSSLGCG